MATLLIRWSLFTFLLLSCSLHLSAQYNSKRHELQIMVLKTGPQLPKTNSVLSQIHDHRSELFRLPVSYSSRSSFSKGPVSQAQRPSMLSIEKAIQYNRAQKAKPDFSGLLYMGYYFATGQQFYIQQSNSAWIDGDKKY